MDSVDLQSLRRSGRLRPLPRSPWQPSLPRDFDSVKFQEGIQFFQQNKACICYSWIFSLTVGLSLSNLLNPLIYTQKSDTARRAQFRYVETLFHLLAWHSGDIENEDSDARKSLRKVMTMHTVVSDKLNKVGVSVRGREKEDVSAENDVKERGHFRTGNTQASLNICRSLCNDVHSVISEEEEGKEEEEGHLFLSQYDMLLVQCGFVFLVVLHSRDQGVDCDVDDLQKYLYCWYVFGYLLGMEDHFNVCFYNFTQTLHICKDVESFVIDSLAHAPPGFTSMAAAFAGGLNLLFNFRLFTTESVVNRALDEFGVQRCRGSFVNEVRTLTFRCISVLFRYVPWFKHWTNAALSRLYRLYKQIVIFK